MALQPSACTLDNVLPAMDFILEMFEEGKEHLKDNDFLAPCINSAWSKLSKYYERLQSHQHRAMAVGAYRTAR